MNVTNMAITGKGLRLRIFDGRGSREKGQSKKRKVRKPAKMEAEVLESCTKNREASEKNEQPLNRGES